MKSGQLNQVFIYIFALILGALILYFGISMIYKITFLSCDVEQANFQTDIVSEIKKVSNLGETTLKKISPSFPCSSKYVCFIGKNPDFSKVPDETDSQIIKLRSQTGENFFLVTEDETDRIQKLTIKDIEVKEGILCLEPQGGIIEFKAENKGNYVELSK